MLTSRDVQEPLLQSSSLLTSVRSEFCLPLEITVVVGILEVRRNYAYWVDRHSESFVMCEKTVDDHTGLYVPCDIEKAGLSNPNQGVADFHACAIQPKRGG